MEDSLDGGFGNPTMKKDILEYENWRPPKIGTTVGG